MKKSATGFGAFLLTLIFLAAAMFLASPPWEQEAAPDAALAEAREATGGAQTRADIMARQEGLRLDESFRSGALGDPGGGAPMDAQLGTLGGASDSEMFRALRYGEANLTTQARFPAADVVIQDTGMGWLELRRGALADWGAAGLIGTILLLALFYVGRGKIRIDGEKTGETITRFRGIERFAHWLLAVSFIILAISGLIIFFGRDGLIPLIGHEAYAVLANGSKWVHNNVAWPFMISIFMVFFLWVWHNIPSKIDLDWAMEGGGLFVKGVHPPAKKFNAGQKVIFWSVVLLGGSLMLSGLSLLFPFQIPMFAETYKVLNMTGIPQLIGLGPLPTEMMPHQEMQQASLWHGMVAFVMIAIVVAHIYIGSVGMEGAFAAMGSGKVEKQWAKEHHSIWYEEVTGERVEHHDHYGFGDGALVEPPKRTPAE
jgi:formate dehydrogenase subunit gamma